MPGSPGVVGGYALFVAAWVGVVGCVAACACGGSELRLGAAVGLCVFVC